MFSLLVLTVTVLVSRVQAPTIPSMKHCTSVTLRQIHLPESMLQHPPLQDTPGRLFSTAACFSRKSRDFEGRDTNEKHFLHFFFEHNLPAKCPDSNFLFSLFFFFLCNRPRSWKQTAATVSLRCSMIRVNEDDVNMDVKNGLNRQV